MPRAFGAAEGGLDLGGVEPVPAPRAEEEDRPPRLARPIGDLPQPCRVLPRPAGVDDHPLAVAEELGDVVGAPARVELEGRAVEPPLPDRREEVVLVGRGVDGVDRGGQAHREGRPEERGDGPGDEAPAGREGVEGEGQGEDEQ